MGSNANNATSEGHNEDVVFQSKDIVSKTKAGQKKEYFVKFKEKTTGQKFSEWFTKHKKKILIILCAIILAAVATFVVVKIITSLNKPEEEVPGVEFNYESINDLRIQKKAEIEEYYTNSESNNSYADTVNHYVEEYNAETEEDNKFIIAISLGDFLFESGIYTEAETAYLLLEESTLDNEQKLVYYRVLGNLYDSIGDQDMSQYFYRKLNVVLNGEDN